MKIIHRYGALAILLSLLPGVARGTSFYAQPFPSTVQETPVIVRGKVGMHYAQWSKDEQGNQRIYTYYELQVSETLKGDAPPQAIMMRELGGEKDGVGLQIAGTAEFQPGEDVVVFLNEKNPEGTFDIHGMMMGKLEVQVDADGDELLRGPSLNLTPGVLHEDSPTPEDPKQKKKWTLSALRQLIQEQKSQQPPSSSKSKASPSPSPVPQPLTEPQDNSSSSAPGLQPSEATESPISRGLLAFFGTIAGVLIGTLTSRFLRRKK
jgi:hypothetical protein